MTDDDRVTAMAELTQAMAHDILGLPELAEPDWDTYALVVEVSESRIGMIAFRYRGSDAPISTESPDDSWVYFRMREAMRGPDGAAWDVVVVRLYRATADIDLQFFSGDDAEPWRVRPQNMAHLPEALRPQTPGSA